MPRTAGNSTQAETLSRNFSCKLGSKLGKSKNAPVMVSAVSVAASDVLALDALYVLTDEERAVFADLLSDVPSKRSNSNATASRCACSCAKNVGVSAIPKV